MCIKNDMRYWDKWMAERRKVSAQLPMPFKKVYDNCTNNLKRRKLIQIKSRYLGYGICSGFELDCILKRIAPMKNCLTMIIKHDTMLC